MECKFSVGQKVVFVDASSNDGGTTRRKWEDIGVVYPDLSGVYTVRDIVVHSKSGAVLLLLVEINNRSVTDGLGYEKEPGFEADRFRPVTNRKTDISQFQAMLTTTKVEERA